MMQPGFVLTFKHSAGANIPISGQDFSNQDLQKIAFTKGTMRQTNFSGSNLRGVSLFGAIAKEAKFVGADLSNADLSSGDFEGADFTNANLSGASVCAEPCALQVWRACCLLSATFYALEQSLCGSPVKDTCIVAHA